MKNQLARLLVLVGLVAMLVGFVDTGTAWAQEDDCGDFVWQAGGEIDLHGGGGATINIERWVKCVIWNMMAVPPVPDPTHLGGVKPPSVTLKPGDTTNPMANPEGFPAGVTVSAFDAEVDSQLVLQIGRRLLPGQPGPPLRRFYFSGEFKTFLISGCKDVYFIQMKRITTTTKEGDNDPETTEGAWELDGKVPNKGEIGDPPANAGVDDGGGLIDYPGRFGESPDAAIMDKKDEQGPKQPPNRPDNGSVKQVYELETWIVCDGRVIGFAKWGFTITQNFADGAPAGPPDVSDLQTPSLHGSGDSPNADKVEKLKK